MNQGQPNHRPRGSARHFPTRMVPATTDPPIQMRDSRVALTRLETSNPLGITKLPDNFRIEYSEKSRKISQKAATPEFSAAYPDGPVLVGRGGVGEKPSKGFAPTGPASPAPRDRGFGGSHTGTYDRETRGRSSATARREVLERPDQRPTSTKRILVQPN